MVIWRSGGAGALLFSVALLSGCGGDSGETPQATDGAGSASSTATGETSPSGTATGSPPTSSGDVPEGVADAVAALESAAAAVPNGRPFDLERDTYQGQRVWDIKVASDGNQFELYVSEDGGTVVDQVQEQTPDDDVQKLQSVQLEAVDALKRVARDQGGTLSEMEIDTTSDGTVVWQVEMRQSDGSAVEVNLDAATGNVVSQSAGD